MLSTGVKMKFIKVMTKQTAINNYITHLFEDLNLTMGNGKCGKNGNHNWYAWFDSIHDDHVHFELIVETGKLWIDGNFYLRILKKTFDISHEKAYKYLSRWCRFQIKHHNIIP